MNMMIPLLGHALSFLLTSHSSTIPTKSSNELRHYQIVEDYDGDTYRAVYTVKFAEAIYVLHAFQKKSK
jgi:phage-related protein